MAEYTNRAAACVRMASFHVLMDPALLGWETTAAQLARILNLIGEGDGKRGAPVTEQMLGQVFASPNNYLYHKCSDLGIVGGDDKSIAIRKEKKQPIIFQVITKTSVSPITLTSKHPLDALTRSLSSGCEVPDNVAEQLRHYLRERLKSQGSSGSRRKRDSKGAYSSLI